MKNKREGEEMMDWRKITELLMCILELERHGIIESPLADKIIEKIFAYYNKR